VSAPDFDVVVIGGGAVGLACAVHACAAGRSLLLLERHVRHGEESSSRNSGVVHAGIYYPTGSLKARTCVAGRKLLYDRCRRHGVGHEKCGKLIVATRDEERRQLDRLLKLGLANGAGQLSLVDEAEIRKLEPRVEAVAGLLSPETGIVDAHGLMDSYCADARDGGAEFVMRTEVTGLTRSGGEFLVETRDADGGSQTVACARVINAAGLESDRVASMAGIDIAAADLQINYCKGDYFSLAPSLGRLTRRLVYPVPTAVGLGVHITFDLGGGFSAGPDTEYVDRLRYDVDAAKAGRFGEALRRYLPEVQDDHLSPNYAGIRSKLQRPGEGFRDFVIEEASVHGLPGLVNLIGIDSPGLTASEAIGFEAAELLGL
jgi:L-2-hydroxyglutarate oxidase LhgO